MGLLRPSTTAPHRPNHLFYFTIQPHHGHEEGHINFAGDQMCAMTYGDNRDFRERRRSVDPLQLLDREQKWSTAGRPHPRPVHTGNECKRFQESRRWPIRQYIVKGVELTRAQNRRKALRRRYCRFLCPVCRRILIDSFRALGHLIALFVHWLFTGNSVCTATISSVKAPSSTHSVAVAMVRLVLVAAACQGSSQILNCFYPSSDRWLE